MITAHFIGALGTNTFEVELPDLRLLAGGERKRIAGADRKYRGHRGVSHCCCVAAGDGVCRQMTDVGTDEGVVA